MSNLNKFCVRSGIDEKYADFGFSVVVNDKHLVIGNPTENCVWVYSSNEYGKWLEKRKIFPPTDSFSYKVGNGFGFKLQLDGNTLVASAKTLKTQSCYLNPLNLSLQRYMIRLDRDKEFRRIRSVMEKIPGKIRFNLISQEDIKSFVFLDNGEENFGYLGNAVAVHKNMLLIGSPSRKKNSRAWLIDTANKNRAIEIKASNNITGEAVVISRKFAISGMGMTWHRILYDEFQSIPNPITIIRAIDSGLTTTISAIGTPSLSDNILALMRFNTPGRFNSSLKLYRLDKNAKAHLIEERKYLERAWVQNGYLITVEVEETNIRKVCIELIR